MASNSFAFGFSALAKTRQQGSPATGVPGPPVLHALHEKMKGPPVLVEVEVADVALVSVVEVDVEVAEVADVTEGTEGTEGTEVAEVALEMLVEVLVEVLVDVEVAVVAEVALAEVLALVADVEGALAEAEPAGGFRGHVALPP